MLPNIPFQQVDGLPHHSKQPSSQTGAVRHVCWQVLLQLDVLPFESAPLVFPDVAVDDCRTPPPAPRIAPHLDNLQTSVLHRSKHALDYLVCSCG